MIAERLVRRGLSLVAEVRPGETGTALLMTLNGFVLLMAYSCIKPVREALILAHPGGAEYQAYSAGGTAVLLLIAVPAYSRVSAHLSRQHLVIGTTAFFTANLVAFYVFGRTMGTSLAFAIGFYLWIAIFNMMIVAQFGAFANDLYSEDAGRRIFPLLGLGLSLGAVAGATTARLLIGDVGAMQMMPIAAAILITSAGLTQWVHTREVRAAPTGAARAAATAVIGGRAGDAFRAVWNDRYLRYIAAFSLVFTLVKTNGDYVLAKAVAVAAHHAVSQGTLSASHVRDHIGEIFASYAVWVDVISLILQGLLVGRVVRSMGFATAFCVLPAVALGDAVLMTAWPVLTAVRIGKTVESATDYSFNSTTRTMLWLPTSRRAKYLAKQATDTFFVRAGDISSAGMIFVVARLSLPLRAVTLGNVALVVVWLLLARGILRERRALLRLAVDASRPDR